MTYWDIHRPDCPCLGGRFESRKVEVRMTVNGRVEVFEDVPQGMCPSCGSRVYRVETLERLEAVMKNRAPDPTLSRSPWRG